MATATVLYFDEFGNKLVSPHPMRTEKALAEFPGVPLVTYGASKNVFIRRNVDVWAGYRETGNGGPVPVSRIIEYKKNPSLHKCDARCQHAKGRICECSCGGKNHGQG